MFFSRASKYLGYLLFSGHRRGHGIHSPFVFELVSRIFRNKIDPSIVLKIENIRKRNLSDNRIISINDLGSGSRMIKNNSGKVSDIARYSSVPAKYGKLLSNMAMKFGNNVIIEFGTSLGISTMYLASAGRENIVYTMEGCPSIAGVARENFESSGFGNISLMNGTFDDLLPELRKKALIPGLVFIDGDHRKDAVLRYFNEIAEMSSEKSVIILDDIHLSHTMEQAWEEIKRHKRATFTIDLYRLGIVFFRKGMNPISYSIRY